MNKEPTQLIFFGRLEERKGLPEFVEALNHLAAGNDCPPFRVAFVGKVVPLYGVSWKELDSAAFIKKLLDKSIQFSILGDFDSREAIDFVRSSSTAVVCLTSSSDNFPNAALEAGQIPHRLVVSDTKGFHQTLSLIGRTEGVYWFKPGCSLALAQAIGAALRDSGPCPRAPAAREIEQLNNRLLEDRLNMLGAAFDAKRQNHGRAKVRFKAAVVLPSKGSDQLRLIRRSLLALARGNRQPDSTVVVGRELAETDAQRLEARFTGLAVVRESSVSLQELLRAQVGPGESGDYALLMLAGAAVQKTGLDNLSAAAALHPSVMVSAESVLGRLPKTRVFRPPSLSMLVRENNACGSCLAVSIPFLYSLPPLPMGGPACVLWLILLAASGQGKHVSYLPLPQHSVRLPSALGNPPLRGVGDVSRSSLWHYLSGLDAASWSRRELRNLVLSVQQLAFGEGEKRKAEAKLQQANETLHKTRVELHTTAKELHDARVELHTTKLELAGVYASHAWRITKPLRLGADWLRQIGR